MREVQSIIKAAQKEHARVVIELDEAGRLRVVVNELLGPVEPDHEVVL